MSGCWDPGHHLGLKRQSNCSSKQSAESNDLRISSCLDSDMAGYVPSVVQTLVFGSDIESCKFGYKSG